MIGLDTNVIVRYIMQDDAKQATKTTQLIESLNADEPGFIALVSVIEVYWVLTSCFGLTGEQVAQALRRTGKAPQTKLWPRDVLLGSVNI